MPADNLHIVSVDTEARSDAPEAVRLLISTVAQHEAQIIRDSLSRFPNVRVMISPPETGSPPENITNAPTHGEFSRAHAGVGLAHGWMSTMREGDLIVATEVLEAQNGQNNMRFPSADILAGELRREGFTVHIGPMNASSGQKTEADDYREEDHEKAALGNGAIDMPPRGEGEPVGLVYVVANAMRQESDDATDLRQDKATVRRHVVEEALGRIGPVLLRWARAARPREVLLAEPRSLCAGVERAIEIVELTLKALPHPIYVRKQIVHNLHVVHDLEQRGAIFVDEVDEVPNNATLIFSAHGVSPAVRAAAEARNLNVIDATCPLVTKVHAKARRFVKRGDTVVLIGHAGHEEAEGTLGQEPGNIVLVTNVEDIGNLDLPDPHRVAYVTQTTLAIEESETIVDALRARYPEVHEQGSDDICYATTNRQEAIRTVAEDADLILVVGSSNSSNSLRLVELAQREGKLAYLIDDATEIECSWLADARMIGLTAGASAPPVLVNAVIENLRGLGTVKVTERIFTHEDIRFTLPKEVRRL